MKKRIGILLTYIISIGAFILLAIYTMLSAIIMFIDVIISFSIGGLLRMIAFYIFGGIIAWVSLGIAYCLYINMKAFIKSNRE